MKKTWDDARKEVGNINLVQQLIQEERVCTRGMRNKPYIFTLKGTQRRLSLRGEGKIESKLLSNSKNKKECFVIKDGKKIKSVEFLDNAVGLGARRKGNVIADLFGLDNVDSPVSGEVKISDRNPWYAVVETIEQVVLLRSDRKFLLKNIRNKRGGNIKATGAWGLVIAPEKYWKKKEFAEAKILIEYLRKKTKIRICCVFYPEDLSGKNIDLEVVCGLPPMTNFKSSKGAIDEKNL